MSLILPRISRNVTPARANLPRRSNKGTKETSLPTLPLRKTSPGKQPMASIFSMLTVNYF
jgi:hypothetical protein